MKSWSKVLAVLFGLPLFAVLFFTAAPRYIDWQIHDRVRDLLIPTDGTVPTPENAAYVKEIEGIRFYELCNSREDRNILLVDQLGLQSTCTEFHLFEYAQWFAAGLIALALVHMLVAYLLSQFAKSSREALKKNFAVGWTAAIGFSLTILLGQTLLGGFTLYYLTVVLMHRYFPQLILGLVLGGLFAFYNVVKMLLGKISLGWSEPTSEEVSEDAGKNLWQSIRELATRMQIAPPDTVLVGLSTGFYVTEAPVTHASGTSRGRTLHLSAPMMKQLSKDEVLAIVGHELGHFKGEDTVFSTEINPMLIRAERSTDLMAEGGLFGWPASQAMNVFNYFFQNTISAQRRERELLADGHGASVTSPKTFAQALVRYVFHSEAYDNAFVQHLKDRSSLEATIAAAQDELRKDEKFWTNASAIALSHPFDSHPPLGLRIEKLGFKINDFRDHATSPLSLSGFDALLEGKNEILEHAANFQAATIADNQERLALALAKPEDLPLDVIREQFPQVVFEPNNKAVFKAVGSIGLFVLGAGAGAIVADNWIWKIIGAVSCIALAKAAFDVWRSTYNSRLTLNHIGLQNSQWTQMLKFEDVVTINPSHVNGNLTLSFVLKEKKKTIQKYAWFKNNLRQNVGLVMNNFAGDKVKNANEVIRYWAKEKRA